MNWKKLWLAAFLVFIAYVAMSLLIHSVILGGEYMKPDIQKALRPDAEMSGYFWVRIVIMAVFAFFFTFIFAKGYERKGLMEGIRFGIYVTFFYFLVGTFEMFVIFPLPYRVVWYWIAAGLVQSVIMGVIAALVYKPKA